MGGKVGAAAVIIKDEILLHQSKYKLHERCSNNQAEQVAILKALQQIQNLQLPEEAENSSGEHRQQSDHRNTPKQEQTL